MPEAIVFASDPYFVETIGSLARVVQQLPPRLMVVVADEEALAAIAAISGVAVVHAPPIPAALLNQLTPGESIFAEAWLQQRRPKVRAGEGLPWDAEGFEPPDLKKR